MLTWVTLYLTFAAAAAAVVVVVWAVFWSFLVGAKIKNSNEINFTFFLILTNIG